MLRNRILDVRTVTDVLVEPLTASEVKGFLKIGYSDDDTLISGMIKAARQLLEKRMNIAIAPRTVKVTLTHDGSYMMPLPYGPIGTISNVVFKYDAEDTVGIISPSYTIVGEDFKQFRGAAGYWQFTYTAGYTTTPDAIRQGMLKQIAWMYENRGDESQTGQINQDVLYMLSGYDRNPWI